MNIREKIIECIEENGNTVLENGTIEVASSMNFISAILSLEEEFDVEIPEEYLQSDFMVSIAQVEEVIKILQKEI